MPIEVLMPALSPTMTEGTLARWKKKEGDSVSPGEVIAEIETDKATMEVESVDEGTLGKLLVKEGTQGVPVNAVIALLLGEGEDKKVLASYTPSGGAPSNDDSPKKAEKPATPKASAPAAKAAPALAPKPVLMPKAAPASAVAGGSRTKASPLAKRMAMELGVDIGAVTGSGPHGRVIRADVEEASRSGSSGRVRRHPVEFSAETNSTMRRVIASRLLESKQQVPHFYLTVECRIDRLLEARQDINDAAFKDEAGKPAYKVSVNDMVIKAAAMALKKVPAANASWTDEAILLYNNVDISVAVAMEGGLITPIVKNADQKSIPAISTEMKDLAARARSGKLAPEEFQGGGFSISNLGMYGIKQFNAIINPPQGCILAVGAGEKRPLVKEDSTLEVGTVMQVTLSCDHRVVDGAVGAEFLAAFRQYIEKPILMTL